MFTRRNLLRMFGGGAMAGGLGVKPSDITSALGSAGAADVFPEPDDLFGVPVSQSADRVRFHAKHNLAMKALRHIEWTHDSERQQKYLPTHIGTKKSWSPAFKQHAYKQEAMEILRVRKLLMQKSTTVGQLCELLGLDEDDVLSRTADDLGDEPDWH